MTRFYSFIATMEEVTRLLGGNAESVSYKGKEELYRRGSKVVKVERDLYFDDDGFNKYDVSEVRA